MADPTPADPSRPRPVPPVPFPDRDRLGAPLPASLTSFVGREREVQTVAGLLRRPGVRLVTLSGPGGAGKTRLALRVAEELAPAFADGAAFVELAPVRDPALVLPTVAQALGIREVGDRPLAARLAAAVRERELLLVLDNLEQVLEAAPQVAGLLAACPSLTVLVTSRAILRVAGEHAFPVPPLALPAAGGARSPGELGRTEAVALFDERARAADPGFALDEANAASVAAICERLDGLPLAIELAAARITVLSPPALEARLTERLRLLTGGARDHPPRLRSMRDAVAWSYDLLPSHEQALFRCLGCFAGGCTLEAAEAVCGEAGLDVVDGITALVGQSLVRRVEQPERTPRFGMLETIREYALERLEAAGETEPTRRRHAEHFVDLAGRPKLTWWVLEETIGEEANLRAALAWALVRGATEVVLPLAIAVWQLLEPSADYGALERAVEATAEAPSALRGKRVLLLAATAQYAMWRSDTARASTLLDECVALTRATGDSGEVALAMLVLAHVATGQGELERGEAFAEEARRRWQALGEPSWVGEALCLLADIARRQGERARAEALLDESVAIARDVGPDPALVVALSYLGNCCFERGDHRRAAALLAESIEIARRGRDPMIVESSIVQLAAIAAAAGRAEPAVRLFGATTAWKERFGFDEFPMDRPWHDRAVEPARARLDEAAFAAAWTAGRALTLDQAVAEALALAEVVASAAPEQGPRRDDRPDGLTPREVEVLQLLVEGRTNPEIAAALFVTPRTARAHVAAILAKLGVPTRAAAASYAVRHRLV